MRDFTRELSRRAGVVTPSLVGASVFVITSLVFFRVALLPEFGAELEMSAVGLGAVTTVFAVGRLLADLPGGRLADRVGPLRLVGLAALAIAGGSLALGLSPNPFPIYAASFVLGLASSVTNATGMTYFSWAGGAAARGTSMSLFSAALLGGQALGPSVAGLLASVWGWRRAFATGAVVAVVIGAVTLTRSGRGESPRMVDDPTTPEGGGAGLGTRRLLLVQTVPFVVFFALGSIPQTLVPLIGAGELGLDARAIGLALGLGGVARFVGTLVGGRISDRVSRRAALLPGLLMQAVGVALLAPWSLVAAWLAAIVVMSIASFAVPVAATIVADLAPPGRVGTQLGRFRFAGDLGLVIGPVTVSAIYGRAGRGPAVMAVAALLALVAALTWRLIPETNPRVEPQPGT